MRPRSRNMLIAGLFMFTQTGLQNLAQATCVVYAASPRDAAIASDSWELHSTRSPTLHCKIYQVQQRWIVAIIGHKNLSGIPKAGISDWDGLASAKSIISSNLQDPITREKLQLTGKKWQELQLNHLRAEFPIFKREGGGSGLMIAGYGAFGRFALYADVRCKADSTCYPENTQITESSNRNVLTLYGRCRDYTAPGVLSSTEHARMESIANDLNGDKTLDQLKRLASRTVKLFEDVDKRLFGKTNSIGGPIDVGTSSWTEFWTLRINSTEKK